MSIRLLQNCFTQTHFSALIPGFEALDFRENPRPEHREFQVFEHIYNSKLHLGADVLGAVSSRFEAKTLIDGHEVCRWIVSKPGNDVYFVNPWPQWPYANFNSYDRAAIIHDVPDFLSFSQRVLSKAGVPLNLTSVGRQHNGNFGMSSYWFGSQQFWEKFMTELIIPVIHLSRSELGPELHDFLYKPMDYYGMATHRPGGLPFLLERATSLYIQAEFAKSAVYYPRSREQILACCLFPFERDLILNFGDEVDAWDAAGQYSTEAMAYFQYAQSHTAHGWLTYMNRHPINFDHGDPRPQLPWFREAAERYVMGRDERAIAL